MLLGKLYWQINFLIFWVSKICCFLLFSSYINFANDALQNRYFDRTTFIRTTFFYGKCVWFLNVGVIYTQGIQLLCWLCYGFGIICKCWSLKTHRSRYCLFDRTILVLRSPNLRCQMLLIDEWITKQKYNIRAQSSPTRNFQRRLILIMIPILYLVQYNTSVTWYVFGSKRVCM